jgi:hypothetical protein
MLLDYIQRTNDLNKTCSYLEVLWRRRNWELYINYSVTSGFRSAGM